MQIRALTREELAEWWKLYVAAVDKQLSAADAAAPDAAPAPDAAAQLATLQREALSLLTRCRPAFPAFVPGLVPMHRCPPSWARCSAWRPHRPLFVLEPDCSGNGVVQRACTARPPYYATGAALSGSRCAPPDPVPFY